MANLVQYLTTTRDNLTSGKYNDLNIVLGNESCDLDSAVCALVYGAFLHWQYMQIKCKVCTRIHRDESLYRDDLFIPVLNVDRQDYDLKTEVVFALSQHSIDANKLIFRNDLDLKRLLTSAKTSVTLVDHHVLAKHDRFLAPHVTEIIDHRPIDSSEWRYGNETRSTIEITGSCCTLVAQRIKNLAALLTQDVDFFNTYPICSDLLHSCIILDTVNFSKEVNKATVHDLEMVQFLEAIIKPDNVDEFRKNKLDQLVAARRDVSKLSAAQLIRKDYKVFGDVLVPSFPILVEEFLDRPEAMKAIRDSLAATDTNVAVLLGMSLTTGLLRDAAVYSPNAEDKQQMTKLLRESNQPPLKLAPAETPHKEVDFFRQLNLAASRKQYIPIINEFLINHKTNATSSNKDKTTKDNVKNIDEVRNDNMNVKDNVNVNAKPNVNMNAKPNVDINDVNVNAKPNVNINRDVNVVANTNVSTKPDVSTEPKDVKANANINDANTNAIPSQP